MCKVHGAERYERAERTHVIGAAGVFDSFQDGRMQLKIGPGTGIFQDAKRRNCWRKPAAGRFILPNESS